MSAAPKSDSPGGGITTPNSESPQQFPLIWIAAGVIALESALLAGLLINRRRRLRAEGDLAERVERLSIQNRLALVTAGSRNPLEMCDRLLAVIREVMPCDALILDRYHSEENAITAVANYDTINGELRLCDLDETRVPLVPGGPLSRTVIEDRQPLLVHRSEAEAETSPHIPFGNTARRSASLLWAPMVVGDRVVGIISVQSYRPHAYTQRDVDLLVAIAQQTSAALEASVLSSQLRESEERFRFLVQTAPSVILCLSLDGRVLEFNPEAERIFGRARADVLGKDYLESFVPEEARGAVAEDIRRVLAGQVSRGFENIIRDGTGGRHVFSWNVSRLVDGVGRPCGIIAVGQEVTDRRRVEIRLEELTHLEESLLGPGPLEEKIKRLTDGVVDILAADFARIWLTRPGDLCDLGCPHAKETDGPHVCRIRDRCLHLVSSSGRYTDIESATHRRVPFGCYKIGRVAAADEPGFLTNDVMHDPRIHDHEWARRLGLVSFAGYRLKARDGNTIGVLALFARHEISPEEESLLKTTAGVASQVIQTAAAEEALERKERYFRSLLYNMHEDILVISRDYQITDVNNTFLVTTGLARRNIVGKRCFEISHGHNEPCDQHGEVCMLREVFATGEPRSCHHEHLRSDGSRAHVDVLLSPLRDEAGQVTHVIEAVRDVSDFVKARDALQESEERFRTLFEGAMDGIVVADLQTKRLCMPNRRMCQMLGYTEAELCRKTVDDIHPPADLPHVRDQFERQSRGEITVARDLPLLRRDGSVLFADVSAAPIDMQGRPGLLGIFRDSTERREAERAQHHNRLVTEAIASASMRFLETGSLGAMAQMIIGQAVRITGAQMGAVIELTGTGADRQAHILAVSDMAWTTTGGHSLHREAERTIAEQGFYPLPFAESLIFAPMRDGAAILTNDARAHPRWRGSMPDGHPAVESFLGVPMKRGDEVVGMIAVANRPQGFTDQQLQEVKSFATTAALALRMARTEEERSRVEEQLRQSQKIEAIGQLAGGVAHDFNNLLQSILGHTDFALEETEPGTSLREDLEMIRTAGECAATLTRQLLAFSRRQVLRPEDLDLNVVVGDFIKMLVRVIGENIELQIAASPDLGVIRADRAQIEQVLMNLIVNARDAMPQGGRITITSASAELDADFCRTRPWARPGRFARLTLADTGVGMDAATLGRVFEPFFTTKEPGRGTGLGLATVHGIIQQHGGLLNVTSQPGRGTTFEIFLPSFEAEAPCTEKAGIPEAPGGTETVLVAEDDDLVRDLTARRLASAGYQVLVAHDGEEAVRIIDASPDAIDLALLDMVMPGMSGWAVRDRVRPRRPNMRFLFVSGYTADTLPGLVLDGDTQLLEKPHDAAALLKKVRAILDAPR